jgi:3',5'-cyclic AMP phosphodiesterase CpdA
VFRIAQFSDLHCGETYFEASLLERAIGEINELRPDVVVCSGDLTTFGFRHEYLTAREYLDRVDCDSLVVVPGNHDSRNVGYVHFEEMFGERNSVLRLGGVTVVAVDSTEPDLDHGQIGRGRYRWIEEQFAGEADLRIFVVNLVQKSFGQRGGGRLALLDGSARRFDGEQVEVHGRNNVAGGGARAPPTTPN